MRTFLAVAHGVLVAVLAAPLRADDPLPSWNDGASKSAIVEFVTKSTREGAAEFVKPEKRIAVFDNDGTLWCEQPMYFQGFFAFDRVKALAPQHPEWKDKQPFAAIISGDKAALAKQTEHDLMAIIAATHAGMTTDEFNATVKEWLATAKHPKYQRPYQSLTYQPMLEVLVYLRANGFKTFIVSGGGVEFMRVFAEQAYGIPPEQVIGSSGKMKLEVRDGKPVLLKLPEIGSVDDKEGKPININLHIGRRPVMAFGNSDGDLAMLQWTAAGDGPRFGLLVHHTDADREFTYDRESHIGRLDKALDEANSRGWTVVDMKRDWKTIFKPVAD
jgi:phosphoglycolate phosphatase-like HAD superfamily hydrolase